MADDNEELARDDEPRVPQSWPSIVRSSNAGRMTPTPAGDRVGRNQARRHRFERPK